VATDARRPLRLTAVAFACYAVAAGLVVDPAAYFPASLLNTQVFSLLTGGLPIQMVRGVLAVMITCCVWHFMPRALGTTPTFAARTKYIQPMLVIAVTLIVLLVGGWITTDLMGQEARHILQQRVSADAVFTARTMTDELNDTEHAATALASLDIVQHTVQSHSADDLQRLNLLLDQFNTTFAASVCYVMKNSGLVIASSNRHTSTSFVGHSYKFRPYFQTAMTGRLGTYFAVGVTSNARGYFAAYPIRDTARHIIGVAVVKMSMELMEMLLHGADQLYLVDPHCIIFLTNQPARRFSSLWSVPEAVRRQILASKQFGRHETFPPLFQQVVFDRAQLSLNGEEVLAARKPMSVSGWSVVLFSPLSLVHLYRLFGISISFVLILLAIGAFLIWQIINESSSRIAASELLYRTLIDGSPNIVSLFDEHGRYLLVNPAGLQALEFTQEALIGTDFVEIWPAESRPVVEKGVRQVLAGERATFEAEYRHKHGRTSVYLVVLNPLHDDNDAVHSFIGICTDITERKRAEEITRHNAQYDPLTDLPNRLYFHELLVAGLDHVHRYRKGLAILYLDIDHFKQVNDTYGHAMGDAVLKATALRLKHTLRGQDIVSRRGGDEFTILLPEIQCVSDVENVCEKIIHAFDNSLDLNDQSICVTPSIGIAMYPTDGEDADTLLHNADAALYYVKEHGRNGYRCYHAGDMRSESRLVPIDCTMRYTE
jgi:diguanylate cyclase (GGDEF)-like protein/PAS domain S-box-containing protein